MSTRGALAAWEREALERGLAIDAFNESVSIESARALSYRAHSGSMEIDPNDVTVVMTVETLVRLTELLRKSE